MVPVIENQDDNSSSKDKDDQENLIDQHKFGEASNIVAN